MQISRKSELHIDSVVSCYLTYCLNKQTWTIYLCTVDRTPDIRHTSLFRRKSVLSFHVDKALFLVTSAREREKNSKAASLPLQVRKFLYMSYVRIFRSTSPSTDPSSVSLETGQLALLALWDIWWSSIAALGYLVIITKHIAFGGIISQLEALANR